MCLRNTLKLLRFILILIVVSALYACGNSDSDNSTPNPGEQKPVDTTPDAFTFTDQTGVATHSTISSNTITVSGINSPANVSISNAEYSVGNGTFTNQGGTVNNGQTITLRVMSSSEPATTTDGILTIGGVSDTFSVTTVLADTSPDSFSFIDQTDVELNTVIQSNSVSISGINANANISISGGEYAIDGGDFTSASGIISDAQDVLLRLTSADSFSATTDATLTVGGVSDTFSVTTISDIQEPPKASISLTWDIPVFRHDGITSLTFDEIGGYRIYMSTNDGSFVEVVDLGKDQGAAFTTSPLPVGKYGFVVTTYDTNGDESGYSNVIEATVP